LNPYYVNKPHKKVINSSLEPINFIQASYYKHALFI
jgi:hypothetical protein